MVNIKNKSHSVTAEIDVPDSGAEGVIVAQGGSIGGWALYAHEGRLKYCYNLLGVQQFYVDGNGATRYRPGSTRCAWSSTTTAAGSARAAPSPSTSTASKAGEGRVDATAAMIFSADDTLDVGEEGGGLVTDDYGRDNAFSGRVNWVQIDLSTDDADHVVSDEERIRVAMARQ